jgi:hypothetical protein
VRQEKEKTTLCDKKLSLTTQWLVSITRLCSSSEPRGYFRPFALCLLVSCCAICALRWAVSRQGGVLGCARGVKRRRQGAESAPESLCPPIPTRRREDDNSHHSYMYMYFRGSSVPPPWCARHTTVSKMASLILAYRETQHEKGYRLPIRMKAQRWAA